jgi:hypothetical protein
VITQCTDSSGSVFSVSSASPTRILVVIGYPFLLSIVYRLS